MGLEVMVCGPDALFRVFTACQHDERSLILDVRPAKEFRRGHVQLAYCIRLSTNGEVLLGAQGGELAGPAPVPHAHLAPPPCRADYSKNEYDVRWTGDCWWGKHVYVYGDASLKRDHPVVAFLSKDGHAKSLSVCREGFAEVQRALPFLCTASVRGGCAKRYPSQLEPWLYLGDWAAAEAAERHAELGIKSVVTIHNNPENLKLPASYRRLRIELADVETANISAWLSQAYDFLEEARAAGHGESRRGSGASDNSYPPRRESCDRSR